MDEMDRLRSLLFLVQDRCTELEDRVSSIERCQDDFISGLEWDQGSISQEEMDKCLEGDLVESDLEGVIDDDDEDDYASSAIRKELFDEEEVPNADPK